MLARIYFLMVFLVFKKFIRNVVFFCLLKLNKEPLIYITNTSFCRYFLGIYYLSRLALDVLLHIAQQRALSACRDVNQLLLKVRFNQRSATPALTR